MAEIAAGSWSLWYPQRRKRDIWHGYAHARLNRVLETARPVPFDDASRIVFFSDLHRGDGGRTDAFAPNKDLFLPVLNDYSRKGFTYVEVGDGDELWQHWRFRDVRRAHGKVFDAMHRFHRHDRLHVLIGNHDIQNNRRRPVVKDGLSVDAGLILCHAKTGQQILVVHGHQADFTSSQLHGVSRFAVRYIWKNLRLLSFGSALSREQDFRAAARFNADAVVKIPSDVPLIDSKIIDQVIGVYLENPTAYDYVSNLHPPSYPDGNDVEVMSMAALETAWREASRDLEREHTTPFFWENPDRFRAHNVAWETGLDYSMTHRWTIDYEEDYRFIKAIYNALYSRNPLFGLNDILDLLARRPGIAALNAKCAGVNWYRHHLDDLETVAPAQTRREPA